MSISVKQVTGEYDWQAILDLLHESFAYMEGRIDPPSSLHQLTSFGIAAFAATHHLAVIEHQQAPVACAFITYKPHATYIGKLATAKMHRGKGLAKALIEHAAQIRRHSVLELETRIELVENRRAFDAMGFVKISEGAHEGYAQATSVKMQKRLSAK